MLNNIIDKYIVGRKGGGDKQRSICTRRLLFEKSGHAYLEPVYFTGIFLPPQPRVVGSFEIGNYAGKPSLRLSYTEKPNFIVRTFSKVLLDWKWVDEK
jgi:hypothetical protein